MNIGERIKTRRLELNLSQEKLAQKIGYKSRSSINKIELGLTDISQSKIIKFANALDTTPGFLLGLEENSPNQNNSLINLKNFDNIFPIKKNKTPLLGEIACGNPIFADEDRESYIEAGTDIQADFCLKAHGDSMINARILDGDIIFIRKQEMVENGEIAAVIIDNEATLKRVYYEKDKSKLVLQAENPVYPPLVYVGDELNNIRILGKAIAFQSDVK
jgi:repressor LexA